MRRREIPLSAEKRQKCCINMNDLAEQSRIFIVNTLLPGVGSRNTAEVPSLLAAGGTIKRPV